MASPPGILFPEPYIDAALDRLRAELPGSILAQNSAYEDFELPVPDPDLGYTWGVDTAFAPPMIEVGVPNEQLVDFSIEQHDADAAVTLMVRGWLAIDDSINTREKLARANYRLGRALADVLLNPDTFRALGRVQDVRGDWRLNPESRESDTVYGSSLLVLTIAGFEAWG